MNTKLYSNEEVEIIKKYYPNSKKQRLFKRLNRSWCSIHHKAERLGIRRNERFTKEGNKKGRLYFINNNPILNENRERIINSIKLSWKEGKHKLCGIALMSKNGLTSKENHPNWKGGISFEPYDSNWDYNFKELIRKRDNYTCQICYNPGKFVHHIDYNKRNTKEENCITLCISCHAKTNYNRESWINYFNKLIVRQIIIC